MPDFKQKYQLTCLVYVIAFGAPQSEVIKINRQRAYLSKNIDVFTQ